MQFYVIPAVLTGMFYFQFVPIPPGRHKTAAFCQSKAFNVRVPHPSFGACKTV